MIEYNAVRIQETEIAVLFRIALHYSKIGRDVESFVGNLKSRIPDWGEKFQILCGILRLSESLEHDQKVVLDPARICTIGFKEAFERFDAVLRTNQVDNTNIFHRLAYALLFNRNHIGHGIDLFEHVEYRMELPLHFRHVNPGV